MLRCPSAPLTRRGRATRRRLLRAAEVEFGSKGFHQAAIGAIVARADTGTGTFYLYFRSKEEALGELVRGLTARVGRVLKLASRRAQDPAEARRLCLEAYLEYMRVRPGLRRILQESEFVERRAFREYRELLAESLPDLNGAPREAGGPP